ncbi:hypothetical protein ABFV54_28045, partial [Pseudomonas syringae]|uniref:hypothetical protein n=1 Tax=Pseudomonas syringae TaxID=317 RepID=UPI0034D58EF1
TIPPPVEGSTPKTKYPPVLVIKPYFRLVVAVVASKNEFDVTVEVIVPDAVGVPILGVTNVGEVARTKEPVPVPVAKVKTGVV